MENDFKKKKIDKCIELALEEMLMSEETDKDEAEGEQPEFSPEFNLKMEQLIKQCKKNHYHKSRTRILKPAAVFIAIMLIANLSIMNVSAIRIPVRNFILEIRDKYFILDTRNNVSDINAIENETFRAAIPSYTIDGYSITNIMEDANLCIEYKNDNGGWYNFKIFAGAPSNAIDGVSSTKKAITVNDYNGMLIIKEAEINAFLEYKNFQIELTGNIPEDDVMNILKSID